MIYTAPRDSGQDEALHADGVKMWRRIMYPASPSRNMAFCASHLEANLQSYVTSGASSGRFDQWRRLFTYLELPFAVTGRIQCRDP